MKLSWKWLLAVLPLILVAVAGVGCSSFVAGSSLGCESGYVGAYTSAGCNEQTCCPVGYPYYWCSDGHCHTTPEGSGGSSSSLGSHTYGASCVASNGYSGIIDSTGSCRYCTTPDGHHMSTSCGGSNCGTESNGVCCCTDSGGSSGSSGGSSGSGGSSVPSAAEEWYLQGIQHMNSNSYSEAAECYESAIQIYSDYSDAWNGKGEALESLGRTEEALSCFQTAVQINPQNCPAWINEGEVLESLGRYDEAMSCYNQALKIEPNNVAANNHKENLLDQDIPDNTADPPTKDYDSTHPLHVTGGLVNGYMIIHIKEGESFTTTLTVDGGQPPYYWYLVEAGVSAEGVSIVSISNGGENLLVTGTGAQINDPTVSERMGLVKLRVEDSSQLTRKFDSSFWVHVENVDDSEIAAQVAREWYQENYGTLNEILQEAAAGIGYGACTESYSEPIRRSDGYYQVTIHVVLTVTVAVEGYSTTISVPGDAVLIIDTESREVVNVTYSVRY